MLTARKCCEVFSIAAALMAWLWEPAGAGPLPGEFRFDMGLPNSPVKQGWIQVTAAALFDASRGYGWEVPPQRGFDESQTFHMTHERIPIDDMTRDGVESKEDVVFKVAAAPGDYFVRLSTGQIYARRRYMSAWANETPVYDNVTTDYGMSLVDMTFRARVSAPEGVIVFRWHHGHNPEEHYEPAELNSILGIEVTPAELLPFRLWKGKLENRDEPSPSMVAAAAAQACGDLDIAAGAARQVKDPAERALALLWLAGDLRAPELQAEALAREAISLLGDHTHGWAAEMRRTARDYLTARHYLGLLSYSDAVEKTGMSSMLRFRRAAEMCSQILRGEPLYYRAQMNLGRISYWKWREDGDREDAAKARGYFAAVAEEFPDDRLVRMYLGEQVAWGAEYIEGPAGAPAWACAAREALGRAIEVYRWWIEHRQRPDGQMGGGWGDDVEMLRSWPVALAAADDPVVRRGWLRLADGTWTQSGTVADGFSREVRDVQHSAEPTSDTQPTLIGLQYGDPLYVERCMRTMRLMRDLWTAENAHGHRHFRSSEIGAFSVGARQKEAVDLPYHARAVVPGLWAAWYNGNPTIKGLFREWGNAWVEDAMRTDRGKPRGVLPAAIAYETEQLGGYGPTWYDPGLYWSYFKTPGGTQLMFEHLLGQWRISGDPKYLEPMMATLDLIVRETEHPSSEAPAGSAAWAARVFARPVADAAGKWRALSGDTRCDAHLAKHGDAYTRWLVTGDKRHLVDGCWESVVSTKHNFELLTSEVLYTDRIGVRGADLLFAMYTGGAGLATYYPAYQVTWQTPTRNFAALVLGGDTRRLQVLLYNFEADPVGMAMRVWHLRPGLYRFTMGPDADQDDKMDRIAASRQVRIAERGWAIPVTVPSRSLQVLALEQLRESKEPVSPRADLAVAPRDIEVSNADSDGQLVASAIVHNIGAADARDVRVDLYDADHLIGRCILRKLEAPNDLRPRLLPARFRWRAAKGRHTLTASVDPGGQIPEITESNNRAERTLSIPP